MSELQTADETSYRFERDDVVLQILDGSVVSTYRWRRALEFTIDPDVRVDVDGTSYEYVDEDTQVTDVRGAVPHGIAVGSHLAWYEETGDFSDLAIVLDPDGAVLGGFVEEPFDYDEDEDEDESPVATSVSSAGLGTGSGLATETAGRPLVPILLLVVVVVAVAAFLLQ